MPDQQMEKESIEKFFGDGIRIDVSILFLKFT